MRVHTGVGHTDSEATQHFDSEKLSQIFLVLLTRFEPLVFASRVDALPTEPPCHPVLIYFLNEDGDVHFYSACTSMSPLTDCSAGLRSKTE